MSSSWGNKLKLELFGESHGAAVDARLSGLPAGERVDLDELRALMRRRAPGFSPLTSARREADEVCFLGGLTEGQTDGSELLLEIRNTDARPADYAALRDVPRPGHADYAARLKYGAAVDLRGGGAFSGRMTAPLCAAGGVCLQLLRRRGVEIAAHLLSVGEVEDEPFDPLGPEPELLKRLKTEEWPTISAESGAKMREAIEKTAAEGDSLGGVVEGVVTGLPAGLGGPLFEGLEGKLASLLFAIPAVKGVDFGAGFSAARLRGSENNDPYAVRDGKVVINSNRAGGILGGISTGMPLLFRVAFKPTPSIAMAQKSVDLAAMTETELRVPGRHDPCVALRALPVVEAAAALALLDRMLEEGRWTTEN
ncbi:MAG: chorismate synthase [Oscillospiraceae bacterium]|nr:chorismate synthase [Oscillospiraceae bacterium]